MLQRAPGKFAHTLDTITQSAPVFSGVYMLFSRGVCVYVGASDDMCGSRLEHYYEDNPCLNEKDGTHFAFEVVPPGGSLGPARRLRPGPRTGLPSPGRDPGLRPLPACAGERAESIDGALWGAQSLIGVGDEAGFPDGMIPDARRLVETGREEMDHPSRLGSTQPEAR
ncbi:MAG TPA: hypothetical protein VLH58_03460 [Candidatus Methylomirabilis sp.]|nr:hypothetical protein [Candidatus Methylomirabilis sp.]